MLGYEQRKGFQECPELAFTESRTADLKNWRGVKEQTRTRIDMDLKDEQTQSAALPGQAKQFTVI
jgi:hypothetical protein